MLQSTGTQVPVWITESQAPLVQNAESLAMFESRAELLPGSGLCLSLEVCAACPSLPLAARLQRQQKVSSSVWCGLPIWVLGLHTV